MLPGWYETPKTRSPVSIYYSSMVFRTRISSLHDSLVSLNEALVNMGKQIGLAQTVMKNFSDSVQAHYDTCSSGPAGSEMRTTEQP